MFTLFTGLFGKIFSDWRLIAMAALVAIVAYMTIQLRIERAEVVKVGQVLKVEQVNNQVLRGNVETITKVNRENVAMIAALKADQQLKDKAVAKLNERVSAREKAVVSMKAKIDELAKTTVSMPPTPFIQSAVESIQQLRDQAAQEGIQTPPGDVK